MAKLTLTAQQQAVVENRGGSLLVSAAAGSGKTKVLVDRLFRYVTEERCNIDDFLIITYTKAAAAELRGKIASELSRRLAETPGDGQLRRQLLRVYQADIKTVDAFCTALLRGEHPPPGPGGGQPGPDAGFPGAGRGGGEAGAPAGPGPGAGGFLRSSGRGRRPPGGHPGRWPGRQPSGRPGAGAPRQGPEPRGPRRLAGREPLRLGGPDRLL